MYIPKIRTEFICTRALDVHLNESIHDTVTAHFLCLPLLLLPPLSLHTFLFNLFQFRFGERTASRWISRCKGIEGTVPGVTVLTAITCKSTCLKTIFRKCRLLWNRFVFFSLSPVFRSLSHNFSQPLFFVLSTVLHSMYCPNGRNCKYTRVLMGWRNAAVLYVVVENWQKWFSNFVSILQLNKKSELIESKVRQQIDTLLPIHLRDLAHRTLTACKDVRMYSYVPVLIIFLHFIVSQCHICSECHSIVPFFHIFGALSLEYQYKDVCDKSFYLTKCMYEFSPADFMYPWCAGDGEDDHDDHVNGGWRWRHFEYFVLWKIYSKINDSARHTMRLCVCVCVCCVVRWKTEIGMK